VSPRKIAVMPPPELKARRIDVIDDSRSAQPEAAGVAVEQCRVWLNWAAAQVDACLSSDNQGSDQLLAALADLLGAVQLPSGSAHAMPSDAVSAKMSAVIIAVQSHDRVMQGLTHVAESLRALHEHLGDARRADSDESWRMLRETQFRAFTMAQERALFARMVDHGDASRREAVNPEETVEMFTTGQGPYEP
jgi:hypothetical protein